MAVAQIAIKQEQLEAQEESLEGASDPVQLEERILELCKLYPKGISDDVITKDQPHIDTSKRVKALQRLLSIVRGRERKACREAR